MEISSLFVTVFTNKSSLNMGSYSTLAYGNIFLVSGIDLAFRSHMPSISSLISIATSARYKKTATPYRIAVLSRFIFNYFQLS
ncbi:hypothetical protein GCM10008013_43520 [Paenibacillus segetis]|uniref:Uncharacterized protein n=1 Tax=Paenibacillus segetis TaxID=1325360 RepID=A0ABQ1YSA5_9BACL|nr:hypothetical protein GCM10008013_43520 [Paenibacillus segetis]